MPNYDYECQNCSHVFEVFQQMTDPRIRTCPKCSGEVKRSMGPGAGFIFKGSGFYTTDYKKTPDKKTSDKCKSCTETSCEFKKESKK